MARTTFQTFRVALRSATAAAVLSLAAVQTAAADQPNAGLQKFLAEPTSFIAVAEGAPGPVTFASMVGDRLLVQFSIPLHSGETFGEVVGIVDANNEFTGNGVFIKENGQGRAAVVSMTFQDDGTIVADINGSQESSGFVPREAFYSY